MAAPDHRLLGKVPGVTFSFVGDAICPKTQAEGCGLSQRLLRSTSIYFWMTFVESYAMLTEKGGCYDERISELSV